MYCLTFDNNKMPHIVERLCGYDFKLERWHGDEQLA